MSGFSVPISSWLYNGIVASSGTLDVYQTGTTTHVNIYSDGALTTLLPNPVTLDANGQTVFYVNGAVNLRLDGKNSTGTLIKSIDPVYPVSSTGIGTVIYQSTNFALSSNNAGNNIISTTPIIITLPLTTTLNNAFSAELNAQGGAITLTPNGSDKIQQQTAGTSYVIPLGNSGLLWTDAAGNWGINYLNSSPTVTSLNGGPLAGFRNRIINGAMQISQRFVTTTQTFTSAAALAYCVDRFYGYCTGANITGAQITSSGMNRYRFTGAASNTAVGFGTRLEAANTADLASQNATLSVKLSSSSLTTINWAVYYATSTDSFGTLASPTRTLISSGSFTITSTEATYQATIAMAAGAITGIEIVLSGGALLGAQTLTIGDVQLENGTVATPFERRGIAAELVLSERYYRKTFPQTVAVAQNVGSFVGCLSAVAAVVTTQTMGYYWKFDAPMRVVPTTITTYNPNAANANWRTNGGSDITVSVDPDSAKGDGGVLIYSSAALTVGARHYIHVTAESEL